MTDVYMTVLKDEIIFSQTPAQAAKKWFDSLIMQLQIDGFGVGPFLHDIIPKDNGKPKLSLIVYQMSYHVAKPCQAQAPAVSCRTI
jgi:hypothetical protein